MYMFARAKSWSQRCGLLQGWSAAWMCADAQHSGRGRLGSSSCMGCGSRQSGLPEGFCPCQELCAAARLHAPIAPSRLPAPPLHHHPTPLPTSPPAQPTLRQQPTPLGGPGKLCHPQPPACAHELAGISEHGTAQPIPMLRSGAAYGCTCSIPPHQLNVGQLPTAPQLLQLLHGCLGAQGHLLRRRAMACSMQ